VFIFECCTGIDAFSTTAVGRKDHTPSALARRILNNQYEWPKASVLNARMAGKPLNRVKEIVKGLLAHSAEVRCV
jgi:hypothetical protein